MSDDEPRGFKVVDRRQAVTDPILSTGDSTPGTSAPSTVEPDSVPAEPPIGDEAEPSDETEATDDFDDTGSGMPDPALLLSVAAMQLEVRMLARLLVSIFDGQAWRAMGFLADPKTGETKQDLPAAQLAIDCVQFLLGKVEAGLPESERRETQRRLNDLRMNYLTKLREG